MKGLGAKLGSLDLGIGKFPDPIVRLGILFTVFIVVLLAVRSQAVPESFGELGHYRTDALEAVMASEVKYAGLPSCLDARCHHADEQGKELQRSYHGGLSCEVCHGPGGHHVETWLRDGGASSPDVPVGLRLDHAVHIENELECDECHALDEDGEPGFPTRERCLRCHEDIDEEKPDEERVANVYFTPEGEPRWMPALTAYEAEIRFAHAPHAGKVACLDCHPTMDGLERVGGQLFAMYQCMKCHAQREAPNRCEACHHERVEAPEDALHNPSQRESCLDCHSYLPSRPTGFPQVLELQHNPLKSMRSCLGCHDPHDPTPLTVPTTCAACHASIERTKAVSHHSQLACEVCHETAPEHKEQPRLHLPKKPTSREFCGTCHALGAVKPEGIDTAERIPHVDMSTHGGTYLCWQCHYPHFPEGG